MRISFYEKGLDGKKYKFHVFIDQRDGGNYLGSAILQANRGIQVNTDFAKKHFGLSKSGVRKNGASWKEKSSFIQKAFLHGNYKQRIDQINSEWESFSYVGYPTDDFLQELGVSKNFQILINGEQKNCQIYEAVCFVRRTLKPYFDNYSMKQFNEGDYYDLHFECKYFIGNMFDVSDTTSRYGRDRENIVKPTNTLEVNYHFELVDAGGIQTENEFVSEQKKDWPKRGEFGRQYQVLSELTARNLSKAVAYSSGFGFCDDPNYKFTKQDSVVGQFKERKLHRDVSTDAMLLSQYFKTPLDDRARLDSLPQDHPVSPTTIPRPLCHYFFSRNRRGCIRGESCRFLHDRQSQLSSLRL